MCLWSWSVSYSVYTVYTVYTVYRYEYWFNLYCTHLRLNKQETFKGLQNRAFQNHKQVEQDMVLYVHLTNGAAASTASTNGPNWT